MKNTISSRFKLLTTSLNAIATKQNNSWKWVTQNDLHKQISGAVNILKNHNIESGDRVLYKGSNSVEYVSWNLATNSLGAIWVPTSKEQSLASVNHIINDCNPKLYISDENNVDSIDNKIKPSDKDYSIHTNDWDLSTLIYTSGTSGTPKGVTLTNANILANIDSISRRFEDHKNQRMTSLNLLPWSHIFSLTTELYYNLLNNNAVAICEDKTKFAKNLKEIHPEYLYVVPKVLKLIKDKCNHLEKFPFSNTIIPKALDYTFGGNIKTIFIGGAKLDADVATFFENHGFNPCEGYGSTETSPVVAVNHNIEPRDINSVGKILDNVEVKIHNDEILVSGPTVMTGYWGNLAATNKALVQMDNKIWYKTGDNGYVTDDKFLYYTGRMSDNYKLTNGKFVDVHVVETEVRKYVPEGNFIVWGNGLDFNVLITDVHVSKNTLHNINEGLDTFMKIKKIITTDTQQFESAMTQKLSIKRQQLVNQLNHPLLIQSSSKGYTKLK